MLVRMEVGSKARAEKIRTYNFQHDRVIDHRLQLQGKAGYRALPEDALDRTSNKGNGFYVGMRLTIGREGR
ncbi:hypothetical protein OSTOST_19960 [Ostertagia ostertagi]